MDVTSATKCHGFLEPPTSATTHKKSCVFAASDAEPSLARSRDGRRTSYDEGTRRKDGVGGEFDVSRVSGISVCLCTVLPLTPECTLQAQ